MNTDSKKEIDQSLKISYRNDYFYSIRNMPKHKRIYYKIRYVIRSHGKH